MRPIPILLLVLISLSATALAEQVDLHQALDEALAHRPLARAGRAEAEATEAAVGKARSHFLPRVTLSENLLWTDEPAGSLFISLNQEELALSQDANFYNFAPSRKDFETRLTLNQPLYDPDLSFGLRRAEKGAAAARAVAVRTGEGAAFEAFGAYLEVQRAQAARDWVESSHREAEEILRLASERQQAGVGLKADTLRASVQVANAERHRIAAENDLTIARRALALAMGRESGEVDTAGALTPELFAGLEISPQMERADLQALSLQAQEAALAHRQSRAAWLPRAGLSASYALHDGELPFGADAGAWTVRVGLSWELFDGFSRSRGTAEAAALQRAAENRRLEAARQAAFDLEQARLRADEAGRHLESARRALSQAEESQRLLLQRYQAGLSDLSDLLSAQSSLDRARFDAVHAENRLILALGNIHYQNGTFLQTLLDTEESTK